MTKSLRRQADSNSISLHNRVKEPTMRTLKRSRTQRRTRRSSSAWRRGGAAVALFAFLAVLGLVAQFLNNGDRSTKRVAVNVEKRDAGPFLFANGDDRIAPTTVAGNYVNGLGERLDPVAPTDDSLMAKTPAELGVSPAEFADEEIAATAEYASDDELDWGDVGDDPAWREEIALLENECVRFQGANVILWNEVAQESDRELAFDSQIFDDLHCQTLYKADGTPAYPAQVEFDGRNYSQTSKANYAANEDANATAKVAQAPLENPIATAQPIVNANGYYQPRPAAWAPGAASAGSTARTLVN